MLGMDKRWGIHPNPRRTLFPNVFPIHWYKQEGHAIRMGEARPSLQRWPHTPWRKDLQPIRFSWFFPPHNWMLWLSQIRVITRAGVSGNLLRRGQLTHPRLPSLLIFSFITGTRTNRTNRPWTLNWSQLIAWCIVALDNEKSKKNRGERSGKRWFFSEERRKNWVF